MMQQRERQDGSCRSAGAVPTRVGWVRCSSPGPRPLPAVAFETVGTLSAALPQVTDRVTTVLPRYGAALALLFTAYGVWWWTGARLERLR